MCRFGTKGTTALDNDDDDGGVASPRRRVLLRPPDDADLESTADPRTRPFGAALLFAAMLPLDPLSELSLTAAALSPSAVFVTMRRSPSAERDSSLRTSRSSPFGGGGGGAQVR